MTIKITPEAVKERIAALEAAGELSLKEQFYLEALRQLVAAMESEPVAWTWHYREQWHVTNDERRAAFVAKDGDVAVLPLYRHAQPADEDETEKQWRSLALQFDGHRMQAISFLKQILKELPATEFSSAREFLKAGLLTGEEILRNRIAEIVALSQPAPLVPSDVLNHLEHEANHVTAWHHMDEHSCKVNRRDLLTLVNAIRNVQPQCTWTFSNYDDHWSGTCGVEWIFPDGGPEENGVKFCPKCGKSVAFSATEGTEE